MKRRFSNARSPASHATCQEPLCLVCLLFEREPRLGEMQRELIDALIDAPDAPLLDKAPPPTWNNRPTLVRREPPDGVGRSVARIAADSVYGQRLLAFKSYGRELEAQFEAAEAAQKKPPARVAAARRKAA